MHGSDLIGPQSGGTGNIIGRREYQRTLAKLGALSRMSFDPTGASNVSWDSTGVRVTPAGKGHDVDEATRNFGFEVTGKTVHVYPGSVNTLSGQLWYAGGDVINVTGTDPCVYVNVTRIGLVLTVEWINETAPYIGRGVTHDDDNFRFSLCSFTGTASSMVKLRRHHWGDALHAIAPAGG